METLRRRKWQTINNTGGNLERITYDANGNILTLRRDGQKNKTDMDKLKYNYIAGTNKLDYIQDTVTNTWYTEDMDGQSAGNYSYDAIGNLVKDNQEGISNIDWTVYGKIKQITKTNGTVISYTYDAAGNRISKVVGADTTWYVRDAQGNVLSVYNSVNGLTQQEVDLYGSSRLGLWKPEINVKNPVTNQETPMTLLGNGYSLNFTRGKKIFELSNHLGNVLSTVSDKHLQHTSNGGNSMDYYYADFVSGQDYTPFGMVMVNRYLNTDKYRYGFNGKEMDNDIKAKANAYDFGARIYDPRIGTFTSVDPYAGMFSSETPYMFAGANPVNMTDYNGMFKISPFFVKRYPTLAKYLGTILPALQRNTTIRDEWIYSMRFEKGLGIKIWNELLTYGSGPYITPFRPDEEFKGGLQGQLNVFAFGQARGGREGDIYGYPDNLSIGFSFFDDLEAALKSGDGKEIGYRMFLVHIMVMHEGGHWARSRAGLSARRGRLEDGAMSEEGVFGRRFNYTGRVKGGDPDALNTQEAANFYNSTVNGLINNKAGLYIPTIPLCLSVDQLKNRPTPKGQAGDPTVKDNGDNENGTPRKHSFSYDYGTNDDFYYKPNWNPTK
ncbi:RHS repeat-associated core domain-containing protein [Danxiaibacter flavus]|uniref:RHS repeat-associated core domain-containing protein n=1 Tax=Danxiaibacter flavus TaxID=3049108 RepID=A0ABV3Z9H9_9BACT|nr:RHS repeat-associated core domain-containing protein [Chitinophagaceae bacterium DXS]